MLKSDIWPLRWAKVLILFVAVIAGSCVSHPGGSNVSVVDGASILKAKCVVCHQTDMIMSQRLSKAGWTKELEKMIRWGAPITDAEKEILLTFLSSNFGPRPFSRGPVPAPSATPQPASVELGKKLYDAKCKVCHEVELVSQQRLSRAGWTKEIDKMTRWGAIVADNEKEALIDYLVTSYPVRPR